MGCRRPTSFPAVCLVALTIVSFYFATATAETWLGGETVGPAGLLNGHTATSLALDASQNPCIAYYEGDLGDLKFGQWSGGTWTVATVDTLGDTGQYCSLALDATGEPHIAYYWKLDEDGTSQDYLMYASRSAGAWTIETVDNGNVSGFVSLALDGAGDPHITYFNGSSLDLRYATRTGGGAWSLDDIDTGGNVGSNATMIIDASDDLHVAYGDTDNSGIKYATNAGGSWSTEAVAGLNVFPPAFLTVSQIALAVNSSGDVHIVFTDETAGKSMYSHNTSGSWTTDIARSLGQDLWGSFHSMAMGPGDVPTMAYFDNLSQDLKLAPFNGTWWVPQSIRPTGLAASLTFDANGFAHVSYHVPILDEVQYAFQSDVVSDASPGSRSTRLNLAVSPNPMLASTTLMFRAPVPMTLGLDIIDARGRMVRRLAARQHPEGINYITWDGRDDAGVRVGAGVYFAVSRPEYLLTARKVVVVR